MPCPTSSYSGDLNRRHWENFVRSVDIEVENYWTPRTLQDIVHLVLEAEAKGKRLRAVGSGYSFENIAVCKDWLVDLRACNNVLTGLVDDVSNSNHLAEHWLKRHFDSNPRAIPFRLMHVEAGIRLFDLCHALQDVGGSIPTLGGALGQTLAGAISTSTHGSDLAMPPLSDLVHAIHLVTTGGQEIWIEGNSQPLTTDNAALRSHLSTCPDLQIIRDDDLLNSVIVSAGRFGIIYSVVMEVFPSFRLTEFSVERDWGDIRSVIKRNLGGGAIRSLLNTLPNPPSNIANGINHLTSVRYLDIAFHTRNARKCIVRRRWITTNADDLNISENENFLCEHGIANTVLLAASAALDIYAANVAAIPFVGLVKSPQAIAKSLEFKALAVNPHITGGEALAKVVNAMWDVQVKNMLEPVINEMTDLAFSGEVEKSLTSGKRGSNWEISAGSADPRTIGECYRANSIEIVFRLSDSRFLDFVDLVLSNMLSYRQSGYIAIRFTHPSKALISMHHFRPNDLAVSVEITSLLGLQGNGRWFRWIEANALRLGGRPHWGQQNNLDRQQVKSLYSRDDLLRWQTALYKVAFNSDTFKNEYTVQRGLEPFRRFAFQMPSGHYMRAVGQEVPLDARGVIIDEDSMFGLIDLTSDNSRKFGPLDLPEHVALQASNYKYIGAVNGGGSAVVSDRLAVREQETFRLLDLGGVKVAFQSNDGHYIGASRGGGGTIDAGRRRIGSYETFTAIEVRRPRIYFALRTHTGHYIGAADGGGSGLDAMRTKIREHETFRVMQTSENQIVLRSYDGHYVGAAGGGGGAIDAKRLQPREHETFTLIELGENTVALQSSTGHFVGAASGGGGGIDATRTAIGEHERFVLVPAPRLSKRFVSIRSHSGHYVGAARGGGSSLDAQRTQSREHETFALLELGGNRIALQAHSGHYVGASRGGGGALDAARTRIGEHERFTLLKLGAGKMALKTITGHYIGASGGGGGVIDAGRLRIGEHEIFFIEEK